MIEGLSFSDSDRQLRAADLAYKILKQLKTPVHFRDLIGTIVEVRGLDGEDRDRSMAKIYTEINLDSRFVHKGNGLWWLAEFQPKPVIEVTRDTTPRVTRTRLEDGISEESADEPRDNTAKDSAEDEWVD